MRIAWLGHRWSTDIGASGSKAGAPWLAEQMAQLLPQQAGRARIGCYLATANAGADVSVAFWREALAEGVDLVNPRDFPWTLASALAADAARQAGVKGPCYTLVGGGDALVAAVSTAVEELSLGLVDLALVAGIDPCGDAGVVSAALAVLGRDEGMAVLEARDADEVASTTASAAQLLVQTCQALDRGCAASIGASDQAGFLIRPAVDR